MACWLGRQHVQAANVYSGSFLVDLHVVNTLYIRMNVHLHSGCATTLSNCFALQLKYNVHECSLYCAASSAPLLIYTIKDLPF